jgi:predicted TIM-barrel fold metal-dependent hydrolase
MGPAITAEVAMKQGFRIIDSDIHVLEPLDLWDVYLDPAYRDRAPTRARSELAVWELDDKTVPAFMNRPERQRAFGHRSRRAAERGATSEARGFGTQPDAMLEAMDIEGIDISVVFRTLAGHVTTIDGLDPAFAAALCRAFNRWLFDFCKTNPQRLKVGALVPLHDAERAVAEARFAVERLDAVTLVLPSQPINGRNIYDRAYDPLWQMVQELDVAVSFHGIHAGYGEHLGVRYLDNLVLGHAAGQPVELMLCLGGVLTGGVLSRFPRLRMAFLEGNCAWLPWWLWALDERWEKWGDRQQFAQDAKPSELFRQHCYVSVEPDETLARGVVAELGDENLVISSDWPHDDSAFPHAMEHFLAQDLPDASRRRVLWDNCARLYRLD